MAMGRATVVETIVGFVAEYHRHNQVATHWREPLVGVARADDPLFERLGVLVGPTHARPSDLLADARSVIAYFLPFEAGIGRSNHLTGPSAHASQEWARAYVETNRLIVDLNEHLAAVLATAGHRVACTPPTHNFDPRTLRSDWSHKHIAFIAGLGAFGANHLLITERGCAGRLGSVVCDLELESTPRSREERCLSKAGFICQACEKRCPVGALGLRFDREGCYAWLRENEAVHAVEGKADVCGKCGCTVPCSQLDPVAARHRRKGT